MEYASTRGGSAPVGFSEAANAGLAPDGGLYVPASFPSLEEHAAQTLTAVRTSTCCAPRAHCSPRESTNLAKDGALARVATRVLAPFLEGDPLASQLTEMTQAAFDFPLVLRPIRGGSWFLELFHGPTAAFKDFGARFLAECLTRIPAAEPRTVLVATSGDTGGAVASAFAGRSGIRVVILYPKGRVSNRQEKQLTTWGGSIRALRVRGDFDDCQKLVKEAFARKPVAGLTSANSISIARLVPQMAYYWAASLHLSQEGASADFLVPSGNLGNAVACLWAKRCGAPIGKVVLCCNSNRAIADYLESGRIDSRPTLSTLANAMDVGNPSNLERAASLYGSAEAMRADCEAWSASDDEIRAAIENAARDGYTICPHTATAWHAWSRRGREGVLVATAHPAKFETIVEPIVAPVLSSARRSTGRSIEALAPPPALASLLSREGSADEIEPRYEDLARILAGH